MRYVRDRTGRFPVRPHYEQVELDEECEQSITKFMQDTCGDLIFSLPTDALTKLIERDAADLDLYADLSHEGQQVDGVTDFFPGERPRVRIAASLSEAGSENRLRTTLTHEWGHVRFHDCLWQIEAGNPSLHAQLTAQPNPKCKRDGMLIAPERDWMEWQAGYVCGSVLMPRSHVIKLVDAFCRQKNQFAPFMDGSSGALEMIGSVVLKFGVSREAARIRLLKLGFLSKKDLGPSLF